MRDWRKVLEEIDSGTERVVSTLAGLPDEEMAAPSALPGWTRAHVATHIARNADSLWNLLQWARTGVEVSQYPSLAVRDADIEAGAGRCRAALVADVRATAARFAEQARTLPEAAWDVEVRAMAGYAHPAWYIVYRRWNEVEAHHADLAAGYGPADWPEAYVRWALGATLADLAALPAERQGQVAGFRLVATDTGESADLRGAADGPVISGAGRALLGWLSGRSGGSGLALRPDGALPVPPAWPHEPSGL
ncbi:maleylpyruvate isomerase family mycothiol-dependent enzyme [Spirillospora sp. NPDC048911]|uniref:maleylpyruvate isomerase family mycothiol-dependent enzyme n=1 Tax=Spirillospora sp. NPDC048911 TaxID=3364527 RepID=UPI00371D4FC4